MMTTAWIYLTTIALLLFQPASADEFQRLRIVYGSPSWNLNSLAIDSAFLFLRNKQTGQVIKVVLEETAPDSSRFVGDFSLQLQQAKDLSLYEAYIPPQDVRGSEEAVKKFNQLLSQQKVEKKPMAIRDLRGRNTLELFDTTDQAERAEKAYTQERLAANTKPNDKQKLMEDLEKGEQQRKVEKENAQREADRIRAEQIERQKIIGRKQQLEKLTEAQKNLQLEQAKKLAEMGMADYQSGRFSTAEEKFKKSVELDPNNTSFYYQYAVALYKNNKADQALVIFQIAKVDPGLENEKKYYMALCHYKLKEISSAEPLFDQVGKSEDKILAPSATFYRGSIFFEQEKFPEAKTSFEHVIDISEDPQLDRRAEEMIEQIIQAQQFKELQAKRWSVSASVGTMYDSNVLLAPDNQTSQGTTLQQGDTRYLLAGSVENRAIVKKDYEWVPKFSTYYLYSSKTAVSSADPFLLTLYFPLNIKSIFLNKSSQWQVGPGYEILYMDADSSGTRENILNSTYANGKQSLVVRNDWISSHELEVRQDKSLLTDSVGVNDYSAMKYSAKITEIIFLNPARSEMIMPTMSYAANIAKGDNRYYRRFDIGTSYVQPSKYLGSWISSLGFYQLHYSRAVPTRTDTNFSFSTGFSKPWLNLNWGLTATYSTNTSDSSSNQYSKYSVLGTVSWNNAF